MTTLPEITIEQYRDNPSHLHITTRTYDATMWIWDEAIKYGSLGEPVIQAPYNQFASGHNVRATSDLYVDSAYTVDEVKPRLLSYLTASQP
jgi:hypothetical protein